MKLRHEVTPFVVLSFMMFGLWVPVSANFCKPDALGQQYAPLQYTLSYHVCDIADFICQLQNMHWWQSLPPPPAP